MASSAEFYRWVSTAVAWTIDHHISTNEQREGVKMLARELEHTFAQHNAKFDADRFRRDCGLE